MANKKEEFKDIFIGREQIYYMLGNIFIEVPSEEMFKNIELLLPSFRIMAEDNKMIKDGILGIEKFLQIRKEKTDQDLVKFDNETLSNFTRIYCLTDSVPITESTYVSPERLSNQTVTGEINKLQKEYGFIINNESNEGSDHISYELYFLGHLSELTYRLYKKNEVDMVKKLLIVQYNFLSDHLFKWVSHFVKATLNYSESVYFYAPCCYIMLGYIEEDKAYLESLI